MAFNYYGLNPASWCRAEHFGDARGGSAAPWGAVPSPSASASGCGVRVCAGLETWKSNMNEIFINK